MISFHTPLSPSRREGIAEMENLTKKRKWEESQVKEVFDQKPILKAKGTKSMFDMELPVETPLPLEWQRCLDIKSGEIHYYNMSTQKRTSKDPRTINPEPPSPSDHQHMSLDLELNLPCGSTLPPTKNPDPNSGSSTNTKKCSSSGLTRCPSWLAFEGEEREMVTAVCKKCHLLVMMCKSSPACPNCKFAHPPDQTPLLAYSSPGLASCVRLTKC
ncbi:protein CURLY FLAG LEAF 1-like [Actinidia eriantha]|uniref:protein CURLY FLAG LEAF 1-like n=1 Tax=Actinidia eriantha TaxID=165200 RepID=UPI00258445DD|nr:protein CURLY FLAG LEAF 1-like [Actinidia eriantha]